MLDLYNNKYSRKQLKEHIYAVALIDILKTQKLDCSFCVRYILNDNYHFLSEDNNITIEDVLKYQPHISKTQLLIGLATYKCEDDSVEDFESFALRNP
uniref:Uncharacterized protein n=1 Tax=viral metagenome TaxID=1070528 RepID=A0A6C0I8N3_9ZZZZ